jgi:hypothetical protein
MCNQAILTDFLGKNNEIIFCKNKDDKMPQTNIAFRLGIWNESKKMLDLIPPSNIQVTFSEDNEISKNIELEYNIDNELSTDEYVVYTFKVKSQLQDSQVIKGIMKVSCNQDDVVYQNETEVLLVPDTESIDLKENNGVSEVE